MEKQKNGELSRMFGYAGKFHVLTVLGCVLSGISTILSMLPFVCIWLVIRDLIQAFAAGDISLATGSAHYAWMAVVFAAASILIYFIALNCTHLAAFRTATNMRKSAIHHIVTLPLGYFSQNASGRLRNIIDDNAGLTEGFLAHQLPDLTGAAVMPVAVIILIFLFDWRLGICCLIPMGISVIFLKQMMGGDNAQFMGKYMTALETMNKEAVEYIRGIPVVKVFQQTIYSFKNFHAAIEEYEKFASGYALKCRIPLTGFTVTLNGTFVLLIPVAMFILSGVSGQAAYPCTPDQQGKQRRCGNREQDAERGNMKHGKGYRCQHRRQGQQPTDHVKNRVRHPASVVLAVGAESDYFLLLLMLFHLNHLLSYLLQ